MIENAPIRTRDRASRADPRHPDRRLPDLLHLRRLDPFAADDPAPAAAAAARRPASSRTTRRRCSAASAGSAASASARLLFNTTIVALAIAVGKIVISILSAYAIVFFRFPLRMIFFWLIFITLMLPVEVRILPTYKVMVDLGLIDTYTGLTLPLMASATATLAVPPVLPDHPRRTGRGGARRRRRAVALLQGYPAAAVADQHRGAVRHPLHLRLDAVSVAAAGHQPQRHEHHRHRAEEDDLLRRCRHRMAPGHGDLRCWPSCRRSWSSC